MNGFLEVKIPFLWEHFLNGPARYGSLQTVKKCDLAATNPKLLQGSSLTVFSLLPFTSLLPPFHSTIPPSPVSTHSAQLLQTNEIDCSEPAFVGTEDNNEEELLSAKQESLTHCYPAAASAPWNLVDRGSTLDDTETTVQHGWDFECVSKT